MKIMKLIYSSFQTLATPTFKLQTTLLRHLFHNILQGSGLHCVQDTEPKQLSEEQEEGFPVYDRQDPFISPRSCKIVKKNSLQGHRP